MADIRTTGILDTFQRADESPLSFGGKWGQAVTGPAFTYEEQLILNLQTAKGEIVGSGAVNWTSRWLPLTLTGDDIEVWGQFDSGIEADQRIGLALWENEGGNFSAVNGYLFQLKASSPGVAVAHMYRQDSGVETLMQTVTDDFFFNDAFYLMRVTATHVESWFSNDGGANWTIMNQVANTAYRSNLQLNLNTFSGLSDPGWSEFGGGIPTEAAAPQIMRYR